MKRKSMKIAVGHLLGRKVNRIISVANSTAYDPDQELSDKEVNELCLDRTWDILRLPMHKKEI